MFKDASTISDRTAKLLSERKAHLLTGSKCQLTIYQNNSYLSFSMNLMKSRFGGLGMRPRQLHIESSSDPKPLYGGISLAFFDVGSALYVIASKLSREQKKIIC